MQILSTSQLIHNDHIKYTNEEQYKKDYAKYLDDYNAFIDMKSSLKDTIDDVSDLDYENIQYFKPSELKEMFSNKEEADKAYYLKRVSDFSNDDDFNKILFEKALSLDSKEVSDMLVVLNYEKNFDKSREFDFPSKYNLRARYNEDDPNESEFKFEDKGKVLDFINNVIYHLDRGKKTNESISFSAQFVSIKNSYKENLDQSEALLTQMTKYTKPQTLQEAQRQKDEEQVRLAMEYYELNPDDDFHRFTFGIMKQGYSKNEAFERANVYSSMNLIPRDSDMKKFGIEEYINDVGYLSRNSELKQSLMESFEKMDTKQLKAVGYGLSSEFSADLEEILGKRGSPRRSNEEIMENVKRFWDEKFGTTEKIMDMFKNERQYYIDKQENEKIDFQYVIDAYNLLMGIFEDKTNEDKTKTDKTKKEE